MLLKPITSEKAVKMIEIDNTLLFSTERRAKKPEIKKAVEEMFKVKIDKVNTFVNADGEKRAYVKFSSKNPAIDIATQLGLM